MKKTPANRFAGVFVFAVQMEGRHFDLDPSTTTQHERRSGKEHLHAHAAHAAHPTHVATAHATHG